MRVPQRGRAASILGAVHSLAGRSPEQPAVDGPALSGWWDWEISRGTVQPQRSSGSPPLGSGFWCVAQLPLLNSAPSSANHTTP